MKVMTLMGTRPEMIKMWSTLQKLEILIFNISCFIQLKILQKS